MKDLRYDSRAFQEAAEKILAEMEKRYLDGKDEERREGDE